MQGICWESNVENFSQGRNEAMSSTASNRQPCYHQTDVLSITEKAMNIVKNDFQASKIKRLESFVLERSPLAVTKRSFELKI